jgi:hypothetical protein
MVISSVLVAARERDCAAAGALARQGVEVTLIDGDGDGDGDWGDAGVALTVGQSSLPTAAELRGAGVEVRAGVGLIGFVAVDRHVEAELSDGRIENYDAIVIGSAGALRVIARPDAVQAIARALAD